jgi:hypothetical protein
MRKRFLQAMAAYVAIAIFAIFALTGPFRIIILILMAGFAAKTWIHYLRIGQ